MSGSYETIFVFTKYNILIQKKDKECEFYVDFLFHFFDHDKTIEGMWH